MEAQELRDVLVSAVRVSAMGDGLRVTTHCLYPSNNAVGVALRGRGNEFVISDDGGAALELSDMGFVSCLSDRQMGAFVKPQGLKVRKGAIFSPVVSRSVVPAALILVANASKEVADWGSQHLKFRVNRNFKADLAALLQRYFHESMKNDALIIGASNKQHKFGHIIYLHGNRKLIIDPVINDGSSINSRVVANMDVRLTKDPNVIQLIVYDDAADWQASDLKLLELGAKTVAFSSAEAAIRRIAA